MTMADTGPVVEAGGPPELERAAAVFGELRPRLFGIAYRMLGTVTEAEDLVQDVWLRWQGVDRGAVLNPGAYLATVTTRLAINATQSARARRETYVGPWLPEPVDTSADPYLGAERAEALEFAVLLLMSASRPTSARRTCYARRSTTRTGRSPTSCS
jgi:RNA polymerase sigma-70 factor (ECF subfamily)